MRDGGRGSVALPDDDRRPRLLRQPCRLDQFAFEFVWCAGGGAGDQRDHPRWVDGVADDDGGGGGAGLKNGAAVALNGRQGGSGQGGGVVCVQVGKRGVRVGEKRVVVLLAVAET